MVKLMKVTIHSEAVRHTRRQKQKNVYTRRTIYFYVRYNV